MQANVTATSPAVEGRTVYVMPAPEGLGATLDRAVAAEPEVRRVAICGDRIGGKGATRAWADQLGGWRETRPPTVERHAIYGTYAHQGGGAAVTVSRVESWFGEGVEPEQAAEAMRIVRGVVTKYGTRPTSVPSQTGARMLADYQARLTGELPACPPEVAELLVATSGQGRFEVFPAAAADGVWPVITYADARFQYASCATTELPVGEPVEVKGEPADQYAASWCQVRWEPAEGVPIGLLPYHLDGKRWTWPREGKWSGWCSGAEVHLARQHGYRVEVERAVVWPARRAVMRGWAEHLVAQRDRIGGLPIAPPVAEAARYAVRALAIGCIGSLHTCYSDAQVSHGNMIGPTSQSPAPTSVGPGSRLVRPEWSAAIWALARTRLARVMLAQTSPVLGCTLDGFYVGGLAQLGEDRGRAGHFRIERQGQWPEPITSLPELYAMSRALTPVATEVAA